MPDKNGKIKGISLHGAKVPAWLEAAWKREADRRKQEK